MSLERDFVEKRRGGQILGQLIQKMSPSPERSPADTIAFAALNRSEWPYIYRWLHDLRGTPLARGVPWWTYRATEMVAAQLSADACVFEYGSGGSTLWLASRSRSLTSVEHDQPWYDLVDHPSVTLIPARGAGQIMSEGERSERRYFDDYVAAIDGYPDESFDLVVVDGRCRVACGQHASSKVKTGGMLLLDDSHRGRYASLGTFLAGWERHDYLGLRPSSRALLQTTIWVKP